MKFDFMVPKVKLLMTAFVAVLFFASCNKEYSFENGGTPGSTGTAAFTFTGAPAACTGAVVNGAYTESSPLTASNTVTVPVSVSAVGTYTITTAANNGITFSGTGTFTATGAQTITLSGSGTPTAAGSFNFSTSSTGCGFSVTVIPAGPVAVGTLDCTGASASGVYTQYIALASGNTVSIPVNVATAGSYSITTTVSGATFSGSGTLAAGAQTIVLTGSGTSTVAGAVSFPISLGASSCSFSVTFLPGTAPSTNYLRCSIDGVPTTFNVSLSATNSFGDLSISGEQTSASGSPRFTLNVTNSLGADITTGGYALFSLTNFLVYCDATYDTGSALWSGADAGQANGFVVSISTIDATKVEGTFIGFLYDADGTGAGSKTITAGEFSVAF